MMYICFVLILEAISQTNLIIAFQFANVSRSPFNCALLPIALIWPSW